MIQYRLFTKVGCPNCPPMKGLLEASGLEGEEVDCGTEEGLELARNAKVLATPTVLFYNDGQEIGRAVDTETAAAVIADIDGRLK